MSESVYGVIIIAMRYIYTLEHFTCPQEADQEAVVYVVDISDSTVYSAVYVGMVVNFNW